jgi:hypothetical protein
MTLSLISNITGDNFTLSGGAAGYAGPIAFVPGVIGQPFDIGGTVNFTSNTLGCNSCGGLASFVEFNNVLYSESTGYTYTGHLIISGLTPPLAAASGFLRLITADFTMTGSLTIFNAVQVPVGAFDLSGGGLATMGYLTFGDRTDNRSLSLLFVPEPRATVLFGLAFLASLATAVVRR